MHTIIKDNYSIIKYKLGLKNPFHNNVYDIEERKSYLNPTKVTRIFFLSQKLIF
jgi:hypothetical protein